MVKQKRHVRISKKGKKFLAGRKKRVKKVRKLFDFTNKELDLIEDEVGSRMIDSSSGDYGRGNVYTFKNGEEWYVFRDYNDAENAAIDNTIKQLNYDINIFSSSFIESQIDRDNLRDMLRSDVEDIVRESCDDCSEDAIEEQVDEQLKDPIKYLKDIYGDSYLENAVRISPINNGDAAREAVNIDGVGHFLASYDGNEVELSNGMMMYRVN